MSYNIFNKITNNANTLLFCLFSVVLTACGTSKNLSTQNSDKDFINSSDTTTYREQGTYELVVHTIKQTKFVMTKNGQAQKAQAKDSVAATAVQDTIVPVLKPVDPVVADTVKKQEKKPEVKKPANTGAGDGNKADLTKYKKAFNAKQYQKTIDEIKKIINNPAAYAKLTAAEKADIYSKAATSRAALGDAEKSKQNFKAAANQYDWALANIENLLKYDNSKANKERKALIAKKKLLAEQKSRTNTGRSGKGQR
ncbi:MAG: hypothetical protein LBJ18_00415 [Rickettsiales bacterium]|jgi:antitoxin component HigA of HigAB toxin-antitoxin module|nr:hypothetical protein [Rickettsiales bacterium]